MIYGISNFQRQGPMFAIVGVWKSQVKEARTAQYNSNFSLTVSQAKNSYNENKYLKKLTRNFALNTFIASLT